MSTQKVQSPKKDINYENIPTQFNEKTRQKNSPKKYKDNIINSKYKNLIHHSVKRNISGINYLKRNTLDINNRKNKIRKNNNITNVNKNNKTIDNKNKNKSNSVKNNIRKEYNKCDIWHEYSKYYKLIFEGEYKDGKKWNGKGKEYNYGKLIFEGEYKDGKN